MISCDIRSCVGCRMCEVVCSTNHFGAVSPGMARIRVAKLEEIGIDMAIACLSCAEKPCLQCPTGALRLGACGEILVDNEACDGCRRCAEACPIGAVGFYRDRPLFCDLCGGAPACVEVCPSAALSYSEDLRVVSLKPLLDFEGSPGQKRGRYARIQGEPVRAGWRDGVRIDS